MNSKALVLASFAGDSLALGPHFIYDTGKIDREFGRVKTLRQPLDDSHHKNRRKGDFTHYGDQTLVLLKSIAAHNKFEAEAFAAEWRDYMRDYNGYRDKATTRTLENMDSGTPLLESGSASSDLGGASRIAPLVYRYHDNTDRLLASVTMQTALTHNNRAVIAGARILATIAGEVLNGKRPTEAVAEVLDNDIEDLDLDMKIRAALDSARKNTRETITSFGQGCGIAAALPGVVHLITAYEEDLATALIENVMAGGDSAARGLAAGMILGAHNGLRAIPIEWLSDMRAYDRIMELLDDDE